MRLKDTKGKTIERVFILAASVLTLAVLVYLIFLVRSIAGKADRVFDITERESSRVVGFDFARYNRIMGIIASSTPSSTIQSASSTVSSSTVR